MSGFEEKVRQQRSYDLLACPTKKEGRQEIQQAPRPVDGSDDRRCDAGMLLLFGFFQVD